jgi:hypothetical protein
MLRLKKSKISKLFENCKTATLIQSILVSMTISMSYLLPNAIYHFITGFTDDIKDLKKTIRDALQPLTSSQHMNTNQWAEIDGDLAQAGCYFMVHMHKEGVTGGEHFEMGGRYDDELVRAAGGWQFSKRTITILWSDGNPKVRWQDQ